MVTQDDKTASEGVGVEKVIEALVKKCGSLRKAADALGTSHAKLANWRDGQQKDFLETLEQIRKLLGITEAQMWRLIRGKR